ncbi:MFS transporter [Actinoplanes derwentensis]|uniref:Predicted arabinose efflux permease, MFS family n=1 Tax=Actinoplanes derwentensis TaxID=113562 RepID=A0A1H1SBV4_9ACTN|nr:MFS transporter [Actinoplanes derwentensis]SDS45226.1 Predicted arabinose efflux permease, MFS family [Actinoplanes derwentensis]
MNITTTLTRAHLVSSIGEGAFLVTFALYFTQVVGLPATRFGLGVSLAWAAGFLAGVPLGHLADRIGPRRAAVLLATGTAVSVAALPYARGYPFFLLAVAAYAICQTGLTAARQALLARLVVPAARTRVRARLQSRINGGLAMGSAVGALALAVDSRAAYLTVLALDAVAFGVAALLLSRLPAGTAPEPGPGGGSVRTVLRDRPYLVLTLLNAVALLNMPLLSLVLPLWIARSTDAPAWMTSVVLAVNTLSVMLWQVRVAHRVTDVASAARSVRTAGVVMLVACLVFAVTGVHGDPWMIGTVLVVAALLQAFAEMLQSAGSWEISFGLAPDGRHGLYQGVYQSGIPLARILGPVALTGLILGYGAAGWLVLGLLIAAAAIATGPVTRWAARIDENRGVRNQLVMRE